MELESAGVRTVVICTDAFVDMAKLEASSFGVESLGLVVIPHPIQARSTAEVHGLADERFEELVRLIQANGD